MFKFMAIPGAFFSALQALAAKDMRRMIGPAPPTAGFRGRRGPASSPGKGIHITPNNTGWWRRHASLSPLVITERMLMRHGWYRRKLRKQGIPIVDRKPNNIAFIGDSRGPVTLSGLL